VNLAIIEADAADQVLLGWEGSRPSREYALGSTVETIVARAPCEVTLVKLWPGGTRGEGEVMALAGEGPHATVAVRQAAEFVSATPTAPTLTLLNVQQPDDAPEDTGAEPLDDVAAEAGTDDDAYEPRIVVAEDVEAAILAASDEYDVVCVGATRIGAISQALFGSIPEEVGE